MDNLYLGEIILFAGNFAPRSTAYCNGQLLSIAQNQALFSLLGTTYGGDGRTTFALPDLRGRVPVHPGTGPGLSTRKLGQRSGEETHTLTLLQLPNHTHFAQASSSSATLSGSATASMKTNDSADSESAQNTFLANNSGGDGFATTAGSSTLNQGAISVDTSGLQVDVNGLAITNSPTGGGQAHNNMQPFLGVNYIICTQGLFPSRN